MSKKDILSATKALLLGIIAVATIPIWVPLMLLVIAGAYVADIIGIEL